MVEAAVAAAPMPGKVASKVKVAPTKVVAKAKTNGAAKTAPRKTTNTCACGCGEPTSKYFYPGHDSIFKSTLLKIERGAVELEKALPKKVRDQYVWKKRGLGFVPTKDYKGNPYVPKTQL